ncbi:MAG: hypothetical protein ACOC5T_00375 [Elusimicrobiota bacterium]
MTKDERLSKLPYGFLQKLAKGLNGNYFSSYRNYNKLSKSELIKRVSQKLKVQEVEKVLDGYENSISAGKIADEIKPDDVKTIKKSIEDLFKKRGRREVKIGRKTCDLVFIDDLIAIEIKSARDNVIKAIDQCKYYENWADEVYLAYDQELKNRIPKYFINNGVGLIEYSEGKARCLKKAEKKESNPKKLLSLMTYRSLSSAARKYEIEAKGKKKEIARRLNRKIPNKEVIRIFQDYLGER